MWAHNSACQKSALLAFTETYCFRWFVDERSELYYDPTPLLEYQKEYQQNNSDEPSSSSRRSQRQQQQQDSVNSPRMHRGSMPPGGMTPSMSHSQLYGQQQQMASPRHPYPGPNQGMGGPYGGMAPIPPSAVLRRGRRPAVSHLAWAGPGHGHEPGHGHGAGDGHEPGHGHGRHGRLALARGAAAGDAGDEHGRVWEHALGGVRL